MANRRKSDSPQKAALREMMGNFMKENDIQVKDGTDVNSIMRDMMSIILEGMSTSDIESHMRELYDIEISDSTISRVIDKVLPLVYGRDPLSCAVRRENCKAGGIYRYWH